MTLEIETVPCLDDNYAFLVHDRKSGATALFDAPEAEPILADLQKRNWQLTHIFITHHHGDHIDAVPELVSAFHPEVIGAARDAHRLPSLDTAVEPGETYDMWGRDVQVFDAAGHTTGHVAYYLPRLGAVFTGDSLMALGCGRLFEGTPAQMWETLSRLAALPDDTIVCSGHEYTTANGKFALTIEPENPALKRRIDQTARARALGTPTVPSALALEKATNPFLRAGLEAVKAGLEMNDADDVTAFAHIRAAKDAF